MKIGFICTTIISFLLAACAAPTPREPLKGHLNTESTAPAAASANIPAPVQQTLALPKPRTTRKAETYSVVVNNVPVRDLLFALARDAKVNVDIHPGITGTVTLNAIDQTLPQLLTRISKQVDMRFELDGPNLAVMPDSPFLKHYKVDYVNMARNVTGTVSTNTQIATGTSGGSSGNTSAPSTGGGGNISNTRIENTSRNQFWESLEKNIKDILRETDKVFRCCSVAAGHGPTCRTVYCQCPAGQSQSELGQPSNRHVDRTPQYVPGSGLRHNERRKRRYHCARHATPARPDSGVC